MTHPSLKLYSTTRCSGDCCRSFHLKGYSRSELQHRAFKQLDNAEELAAMPDVRDETKQKAMAEAIEVAKVAAMIRPFVGESPSHAGVWRHEKDHFFTCVHFDGTNCTNYEERPNICRDYPYGNACEQPTCTWKEGATITAMEKRARGEDINSLLGPSPFPEPCTHALIPIASTKRGTLVKLKDFIEHAPIQAIGNVEVSE
jgi:Fe-S-cluster containining protein